MVQGMVNSNGVFVKEITNAQIVAANNPSPCSCCSAAVPEGAVAVVVYVAMASRGASSTPFSFSDTATELCRLADSYTGAGQGSNPLVVSVGKINPGVSTINLVYDSYNSSATFAFLCE